MELYQQQITPEEQTEAHLVWALSWPTVVVAAADMAAVLLTPGVLEVAHSAHLALQVALLIRSHCRQVQLHTETEGETLLVGGLITVLVVAVQALQVAIESVVATRPLSVAQV
jgi:hypothetical protein